MKTFTNPTECGDFVARLRDDPANKHFSFVPKRLFEERNTYVVLKYLKFEDPWLPNELGQVILEVL